MRRSFDENSRLGSWVWNVDKQWEFGVSQKNFKNFFKKSLDLKIKTIITVGIMKLNRPFPVYSKLGAQNATLRARCCPVCFMRM